MTRAAERYTRFINKLPAPGGQGAHQALYAAGCFAFRAGVPVDHAIAEIGAALPTGTRHVPASEIEQAVRQAYADISGRRNPARTRASPRVSPHALARLLRLGRGATEADIVARSSVPLVCSAWEVSWRVLEALYGPDELLFVGDDKTAGILGSSIRSRLELVQLLQRLGSCPFPKIIPNPLTGKSAPKKSGEGTTLRGDACVSSYRLVVVEHDRLPLADQLAFWMAAPLPVVALIFSGKRSVHGWVRVDCADSGEWVREVEQKLFPEYLTPMGFDPACRNASRLSRMPGHLRPDTGQMQRCLYLAPNGKAVGS
jgi:hypothetical protein